MSSEHTAYSRWLFGTQELDASHCVFLKCLKSPSACRLMPLWLLAVPIVLSGTSSAAYATVKRFSFKGEMHSALFHCLYIRLPFLPFALTGNFQQKKESVCLQRIKLLNQGSCDRAVFSSAEANINESFSFPILCWPGSRIFCFYSRRQTPKPCFLPSLFSTSIWLLFKF